MGARRISGKDLRRRIASRPERKTVVVFCEGEASEPDYINGLKRLPEIRDNTAISLEIDPKQGVPLTLVNRVCSSLVNTPPASHVAFAEGICVNDTVGECCARPLPVPI